MRTFAALLFLAVGLGVDAEEVTEGQTKITLPAIDGFTRTQRTLLAIERKRSAAIAAHDLAFLSTVYAADFRGIAAGGRRLDRETLFQVFSRDLPESRFLIDELEFRDFGSSAVVSGRLRTTTLAGDVVGESRYIHLYQRRAGKWQIVSAAGSVVVQR